MFKTGDKVKVITPISYKFGSIGVMTSLCKHGGYFVEIDNIKHHYLEKEIERVDDMDISERLSEVIEENQKLKSILGQQNLKLSEIQADLNKELRGKQGVSDEEFREAFEFYEKSSNIYNIWGESNLYYILKNMSLSEFVNKYKGYKDKQNEIRVGNEISYVKAGERFKGAVLQIFNDGEGYKVFCENGCGQIVYPSEKIEKTGRHFDEVESLLSKLKEGD